MILSILSALILSFLDLSSYNKMKIFIYNAIVVFIFNFMDFFINKYSLYRKTLKELNEMELSREFEIKALKRRIIPQMVVIVILLISGFAFEQKAFI